MKRLWDADHAYYCSDSNFFSRDYTTGYGSWQEFVAEEGELDDDLNLLFRWDWKCRDYEEHYDPGTDPTQRNARLQLCYMLQRKGIYRVVEVLVRPCDEPAIRAWLLPRLKHLLSLWAPLNTQAPLT